MEPTHADVVEHPFVTSSLRFPGVALHLLKKGNVELNVFHHNVAISNCFSARSCSVRDWCQIPPERLKGAESSKPEAKVDPHGNKHSSCILAK